MSNNGNKNKSRQLGMPAGTAQHKLRKMIMFDLIRQLEKNKCFHCSELMTIDDFSIEHKTHWQDNDISFFWDLSNISFSHLKCNVARARKTRVYESKKVPENYAWCSGCQKGVISTKFSKNKSNRNGFDCYCKTCAKSMRGNRSKN